MSSLARLRAALLPLGWIGLIAGAVLAFDTPVARSHYCSECGLRRDERQLRFAGWTLPVRTQPREASSHLSEILRAAGVNGAHLHRWRPAECPVLRSDLRSPESQALLTEAGTPRVVSFVRELEKFTDRPTVARWHGYLANAPFLRVLDGRLRFLRFPQEGFGSREEFLTWWRQNAYSLYREIEITPQICC
ncbi:MAG: hypothetical protein JSR82_14015 [Verrucomicrobia bacterium]|nr:hypothetical protein [Verrucomicrobiota bacterium]